MNYSDVIVDVIINDMSLLSDFVCQINLVTISALVKKRYLVDIVGTDGNRDLTDWFGAPRFESRVLKIYAQCYVETATACANRLANLFAGKTVEVQLSFDSGVYRTGIVTQIAPTGPLMSDEVVITIDCNPYRYAVEQTVHTIPASADAVTYIWVNLGTQDVIPEIVSDSDTTIICGTAQYSLTKGTYILPGLAIPGNSSISVEITGGAITASYREAVL